MHTSVNMIFNKLQREKRKYYTHVYLYVVCKKIMFLPEYYTHERVYINCTLRRILPRADQDRNTCVLVAYDVIVKAMLKYFNRSLATTKILLRLQVKFVVRVVRFTSTPVF